MGKRGPGSTKVTLLEATNVKRPLPPVGMTEMSRIVWKRIAGAYAPDHFKPQHYGMLRIYCEFEAINKVALKNAAKEEYLNPHWFKVADNAATRCAMLATKLGITRNNTMAARGKGGEAPVRKSKREGLLYGGKQ